MRTDSVSCPGVSNHLVRAVCDGVPSPKGEGMTSWSLDNESAVAKLFRLYARPGMTVVDPTYGKGVFYRRVEIGKYRLLSSDLATHGIDARSLPYEDDSADVVMFDPPYRYHAQGRAPAGMQQQYRVQELPTGMDAVLDLYREGIAEAARVLRHGGHLMVKCQDSMTADGQRWVHCDVMRYCADAGLATVDMLVVVSRRQPRTRWLVQRSLRKTHSYFIVARKGGMHPFGRHLVQRR